jgi:adenine phosphoribosyltransferase
VNLFNYIDEIPDFPFKGIKFKDISPLLENSDALDYAKNKFLDNIKSYKLDLIGGLDARGFLFSTLIADAIGIGSFMIRKHGKLPGDVISKTYDLEYGSSSLSIQKKINLKNKNIILVDDLLATGGTLKCAEELVCISNGNVVASLVLIELVSLMGKNNLNCPVYSLLKYDD